jgi:methionyl aminopeptidase
LIVLKTSSEIALIKEAGQIVARTLDILERMVKPGITTGELDKAAFEYISSQGGEPAFKGYRGYPASICTSVNEQVVHGIPSERQLKEGDIISLDVGVELKSYYADAARTVSVGKISSLAERLIKVTQEALDEGIRYCRKGNRLSDISHAIQRKAEENGFSVVRKFVGHGIGKKMHEEPQIPNYGPSGRGQALKEGMVFALEPMINAGGYDVEILPDNWTVVTADRSLSAHFEHTVAVNKKDPLILTSL